MKKFIEEFKKFIKRGNVLDLAVGIIIGSAFTAIVNSLVKDIITPLIVWATPVDSLTDLSITLKGAQTDSTGAIVKEALTWNYGNFIQQVINFFLIAFVVFMIVKAFNKSHEITETAKKKIKGSEEKVEESPKPVKLTQEDYLKQIVELLENQNKPKKNSKRHL